MQHHWRQIRCYEDWHVFDIEPIYTTVCKWQCEHCARTLVIPEPDIPPQGECDLMQVEFQRQKHVKKIAEQNAREQAERKQEKMKVQTVEKRRR